jgi:FixJ family two-component response regulator
MSNTALVAVIEDDKRVRESLETLLQSATIRASFFQSAEEFLLEDDMGKFGCMVTDMKMPGLSGLQLYRYLLDRQILIPTIFIWAFHDESEVNWLLTHGAVTFLKKPFDGEELLAWIAKAMGGSW